MKSMPTSHRLALGIAYDGRNYQGWQSQRSGLTVQDQLEKALSKLAQHPVSTLCSGRTDAGVHGLMQVVHFDTVAQRPTAAWVRGTNANLPENIAVQWAQIVPDTFHCRHNALSRKYVYILWESAVRPSVQVGKVGWTHHILDEEAMQSAADALVGEHDFSSFRAAACQALTPIKNLQKIIISHQGSPLQRRWLFEFEANAFLHHMIRNIMGTLLLVGSGKQSLAEVKVVLAAKNRQKAAPTFPADGLYFLGPTYAPDWRLPEPSMGFNCIY